MRQVGGEGSVDMGLQLREVYFDQLVILYTLVRRQKLPARVGVVAEGGQQGGMWLAWLADRQLDHLPCEEQASAFNCSYITSSTHFCHTPQLHTFASWFCYTLLLNTLATYF